MHTNVTKVHKSKGKHTYVTNVTKAIKYHFTHKTTNVSEIIPLKNKSDKI